MIVQDFLAKLYGDSTAVDDFKPRCLKVVRDAMIQSRRFCRRVVNSYTRRIVAMFAWGVEHDLVLETTWRALKVVKALPKGHSGTFDKEERQPVPDEVIRRTLPYMPPTLRAMVQLQRILGMRPSEVIKMRVGDVDTTRGNGLWYYVPGSYKTARYVGKIVFPLGKPEQNLIAPYLVGKTPEAAVFSPNAAQAERNAEKRANRKTKISPSQAARDKARAAKFTRYGELYDHRSYRQAIIHAITKGNKILPEEQRIPHWSPLSVAALGGYRDGTCSWRHGGTSFAGTPNGQHDKTLFQGATEAAGKSSTRQEKSLCRRRGCGNVNRRRRCDNAQRASFFHLFSKKRILYHSHHSRSHHSNFPIILAFL